MLLSFQVVSAFAAWAFRAALTFRLLVGHCEQIYLFLPEPCGEKFRVRVDCQTTVDKHNEPGTGHLMAEPAASGLASAIDENADAVLVIKLLALNNKVLELTAEVTKQEIRCEFVHHQMGVLPSLQLPLQVDQLPAGNLDCSHALHDAASTSDFWIAEYCSRFSYSSIRGSKAARALVWPRMQQSRFLNRRAPLPL